MNDEGEEQSEGVALLANNLDAYPELLTDLSLIKALVKVIAPGKTVQCENESERTIANIILKMGDPAFIELAKRIREPYRKSTENAINCLEDMLYYLRTAEGGLKDYPKITVEGVQAIREKLERILPSLEELQKSTKNQNTKKLVEVEIAIATNFLRTLTISRRDN